jgi:pyruvate dehydrogenase E2 component (dihydrolipoamide acetyltransferase)
MVAEVQEYRRIEGVQETLEKLGADLAKRSGRFPPLPNDVAQRTLVMWGGKDKIFPVSQCDKFPAAARKHTFAGVGHMPHIESADFNKYLAQFVESSDETA